MMSLVITLTLLSVLLPALLWWRSFVKLSRQTAQIADDLAWRRVQQHDQTAKILHDLERVTSDVRRART